MSIINNNLLLAAEEGGYRIERSLRFRSSASAFLNRTPSTAGNRRTWTWSGWVKRGALGVEQQLFHSFGPGGFGVEAYIRITSGDQLGFQFAFSNGSLTSTQVLRDPSAWYHVIVSVDSNQATSSDRVKFYINGQQVTAFSSASYPTQNSDGTLNQANAHAIGARTSPSEHFDGYLTEINFVDGQAMTPSSFGEFNEDTGVWQPKRYAGTYGTNGFYLNFKDNASTSALGTDYSGRGNNWTTNNISLTAGATYDSMIDVPTPYDDGNNGRGNYCTFNPLNFNIATPTFANGNLQVTPASNNQSSVGTTLGVSSGKWYCEIVNTTGNNVVIGVTPASASFVNFTAQTNSVAYYGFDGSKFISGSNSSYGASYTSNDVIGIALDMDGGTITFYKNNVSQGAISLPSTSIPLMVYVAPGTGSAFTFIANFGQRPFAYTPPTGFKALNTQNLPEPTIVDGGEYFNTVLYTGNGGTNNITGVGFQPDFVWTKGRASAGQNHLLSDAVRGVGKSLITNNTNAEGTRGVTSFNSDGFTYVWPNEGGDGNLNGEPYVGWNWKANGAGVTNTAGSITSTVSANPTAGFSIVTWTGNGSAGATVGHGLGVTPQVLILKDRSLSRNWLVYHESIGNDKSVNLNTTGAAFSSINNWNNTSPTSSVFSTGVFSNENASNYVTYCFSEVAGYSRFGSYTGNGSADGPFVFCGFRPRFVMVKRTNNTSDWWIYDTARSPHNVLTLNLYANSSAAEDNVPVAHSYDMVSNGFKVRMGYNPTNNNGDTYIFMAFAENPFKYSLAR